MYSIPSGALAYAVQHKTYLRDKWPVLQWAEDESVLMRTVTNEVHFLNPSNFAAPPRRLRCTALTAASLSPGPNPVVAAFVPEAKGAPASLRIYALPPASAASGDSALSEPAPLARRSFFRVTYVKFRWNAAGSAVLVLATADVDATNQSYYGESSLHFLRADGAVEAAVPLPKEGPVHDVAWSPRGNEFACIYGFMPARCTVFSDALKVLVELPAGPYNTARWNPHGRFLALGGFGNLPGDLVLLDRKADGKLKPIIETRLPNTVALEWAPCGRLLLAATTAPRLQVDNGLRIVRYTGEVLLHRPAAPSQLYAADWRPAPRGLYPDRPQTPGAAAAAKTAPSVVAAAKAAPYRPPGAAGGARDGVPGAPQFSLARDVQPFLKPGAAAAVAASRAAGPPGAEFVEGPGGLSKSAKKRASAKKANAAAEGVGKLNVK